MKIAVTGSRGQIGRRLVSLGAIPFECSILDKIDIKRELHRVNPDLIIHTAALSDVDACEKDYKFAMSVNTWGYNNICDLVENGRVILLSSEQVFDGISGNYKEDDAPNPVNNYGLSKLGAEAIATAFDNKIIRLSRGFSNRIGSDIYRYVRELNKGKEISVPGFIVRSYCHLDYIARGIMYFAEQIEKMPKILNIAGEYPLSFYNLMVLIGENIADTKLIKPRESQEESHAPRPFNCGLDVTLAKSVGIPIFPIFRSIQKFLEETPHA